MNNIIGDFIKIPNVLVTDKKIKPNAKYLYAILDYYCNIEANIVTISQLEQDTFLSDKTIKKHLYELEYYGYIKQEKINDWKTHIICLIPKSVMLDYKRENKTAKELAIREELRKMKGIEEKKEVPQYAKDFIKQLQKKEL